MSLGRSFCIFRYTVETLSAKDLRRHSLVRQEGGNDRLQTSPEHRCLFTSREETSARLAQGSSHLENTAKNSNYCWNVQGESRRDDEAGSQGHVLAAEDDELHILGKEAAESAHDAPLEDILQAATLLGTDNDPLNAKRRGLFGDRIADIVTWDLD